MIIEIFGVEEASSCALENHFYNSYSRHFTLQSVDAASILSKENPWVLRMINHPKCKKKLEWLGAVYPIKANRYVNMISCVSLLEALLSVTGFVKVMLTARERS